MPEFLRLPLTDQADILNAAAARSGRPAAILQKDVWLCWVLEKLFGISGTARMVFKGGSSLSKVFHLIHRFSEDVDVTLNYSDLYPDENPFDEGMSKSHKKWISEKLKVLVQRQVQELIKPRLHEALADLLGDQGKMIVSDDGEKLWISYPSGLETGTGYITDQILVEFGGRNATEPREDHLIRPDLADVVSGIDYPTARASVLSPQRTFWEKATLIHVECYRKRDLGPERISRHWYDLALLYRDRIGEEAMVDRALLEDVVRHKRVFYDTAYAHYDACLSGGFRLIPDVSQVNALLQDYEAMRESGMFDMPPPTFTEIIASLTEAEAKINERSSH